MTSDGGPAVPDAIASVRRLYEALANWDRKQLEALLSPDFEAVTTEGLPDGIGGRYEGAGAAIDGFWKRIGQRFEARAEPEEFRPLPDGSVLVRGRYVGRSRDAGGPLDAAFIHVWSFEASRIRDLVQITDSHRWHEALTDPHGLERRQKPDLVGPGGADEEADLVHHDVDEGLVTIRLDRPEATNALDLEVARRLDDLTAQVARDGSVRAVLITASGPNFSVGGDIETFASAGEGELSAVLAEMTDHYHAAVARLSELRAPVVCAVRGTVAGGALGLLCSADLVIASNDSRYVIGYDRVGLTADGGTTWHLPRLVGLRRAQQLFFGGEPWNAQEALEAGLVTRLVDDELVDETSRAAARRLASGPTRALGHVRRLLRRSSVTGLRDHLMIEQEKLCEVADGPDATEGIASFRAKRPPEFRGS